MTDVDVLADAHRRRQVALAGRLQVGLGRTFERYLNLGALDATLPRYVERATPIIIAGRTLSARLAADYFEEARARAGIPGAPPPVAARDLKVEQAAAVLRITGPVEVKRRISNGEGALAAYRAAEALTLRDTKRLILNGGREALLDVARRPDSGVETWSRVSDGSPCSFCAMLVSRGPVYRSEASGDFKAHGGCGCSARLNFEGQGTDGWSPDARRYRELWTETGDPNAFRRALAEARRDPTSDAAHILAG